MSCEERVHRGRGMGQQLPPRSRQLRRHPAVEADVAEGTRDRTPMTIAGAELELFAMIDADTARALAVEVLQVDLVDVRAQDVYPVLRLAERRDVADVEEDHDQRRLERVDELGESLS